MVRSAADPVAASADRAPAVTEADVAAFAAVVSVTAGIHAAPVAERLTRLACEYSLAASAHTVFAIRAGVAALATVLVGAQVDAGPVAAGLLSAAVHTRSSSRPTGAVARSRLARATRVTTASGAGACVTDASTYSVHTAGVRRANVAALAAVVIVVVPVHAGPVAAQLTFLAAGPVAGRLVGLVAYGLTHPAHTAGVRRAGVAALAAVLVGAQVDAGPVAAGLTRLADGAAGVTVVGIVGHVHANPVAAPLSMRRAGVAD